MTAVILAAGRSRRMNLEVPKVLLPLAGEPVLSHVIRAARAGGAGRVVVIIGPGHEAVRAAFHGQSLEYAVQREPRGTADALLTGRELLADDEECVVLCGDAPLVRGETVRRLWQSRRVEGAVVAVLTAELVDPTGYGRVVRGPGASVEAIVEERDADEPTRRIREVNSGAYSFAWGGIRPVLETIEPSPVSGEYYLTDAVRGVRAAGGLVVAVAADSADEVLGINTPEQFARVEAELAAREGAGG
jgi:bifunctional UDP-N-acetylglucosamine pyrophosphorylase/glucosamine-1-phosphate N-acetyltransferase